MKKVCSDREARRFSPEMSRVARNDIFKILENGVGVAKLEIHHHPSKIRSFFLEPHILFNNPFMALRHLVQLVDEIMVLGPETDNLGP